MAKEELNQIRQKATRRKISLSRVILAILGLLFALLALKIVLVFTAKPTISVDYVAEFNRLSKPANYDPNQNAAPYYKKVFDTFWELPEAVKPHQYIWHGDMNDVESGIINRWLALNSDVFWCLEEAARKPYYWIENPVGGYGIARVYEEELPGFVSTADLRKFRMIVNLFESQVRFAVNQGLIEPALIRVVELYRIGSHFCGPRTLTEQIFGMGCQNDAINLAFVTLDRQQINATTLRNFQKQLEYEFLQNEKPLDFRVEKLFVNDLIQRVFTDNGRGGGNLIPGQAFRLIKPQIIMGISMSEVEWIRMEQCRYVYLVWLALTGANRRKTVEAVDDFFAYVETLKDKTPWHLRTEGIKSDDHISKIVKGKGYVAEEVVPGVYRTIERYQRLRAKESALITTIAILLYKDDKEHFPENLEVLISAGYLKELPIDPYSDKPLIYRQTEENFTLYSIGADFDDDGGVPSKWGEEQQGGDQIFWPVEHVQKNQI